MKNNIQKEIQERREHAERLKKIALKLFEQLKSENVSFSDAERIINLLSASVSAMTGLFNPCWRDYKSYYPQD